MDVALPVFLLAGGELFLGAIGLRIAVWVALGWRHARDATRRGAPTSPRDPKGGLLVLPGGAAAPRLRAAA